MQNFLQNNKFFVSVVHCVIFIVQDLKDFLALMLLFFYKIDFSLKISYVPFLLFFLCVLLLANSM